MDKYDAARRRTIEISTLLWSLQEVPAHPAEGLKLSSDSLRILTFDEEKHLADDFAFLSSDSNDPTKVKAVCIEQRMATGLTLKIACNTHDGHTATEFERLFSIMRNAVNPGTTREAANAAILSQIVRMCRNKIFCRLRSTHSGHLFKARCKSAMPPLLLRTLSSCRVSSHRFAAVLTTCEALGSSFERLESSSTRDDADRHLTAILLHASAIVLEDLRKMLSIDKKLDPSVVSALPRALAKLSRYVQIATTLTNGSRTARFGYLRGMSVEVVNLSNAAQIKRIRPAREVDIVLRSISALPVRGELKKHYASFAQKYSDAIKNARWKVHAEIQIAVYYELNAADRPPRVIASNKSACYLCNKFLELHGKYVVPRSHGRLYHSWTLPDLQSMNDMVIESLTSTLALLNQHLMSTICSVVQKHSRSLPIPHESTSVLYNPWPSHSTIALPSTSAAGPEMRDTTVNKQSVQPHTVLTSTSTIFITNRERYTMPVAPGARYAVKTSKMHFELEISSDWIPHDTSTKLIHIELMEASHSSLDCTQATRVDIDCLAESDLINTSLSARLPTYIVCTTQDLNVLLTFDVT